MCQLPWFISVLKFFSDFTNSFIRGNFYIRLGLAGRHRPGRLAHAPTDAAKLLQTNPSIGLAMAEIGARMQRFGANQMTAQNAIEALANMVVTETIVRRGARSYGFFRCNWYRGTSYCCSPVTACQRICAYWYDRRLRHRDGPDLLSSELPKPEPFKFFVGVPSNPWLVAGSASTWLVQCAFTYSPALNRLFHTAPVRAEASFYIVSIGIFTFAVVELENGCTSARGGRATIMQ